MWRHIEFYLINMDSNEKNTNLLDSYSNQTKLNQNSQMSKEEYAKFRQNLILSLNSNFLKRFSIIDQVNLLKEIKIIVKNFKNFSF